MCESHQLGEIMDRLIEIVHKQVKETQRFKDHVERTTGHLAFRDEFSIIASELSELQVLTRHLAAAHQARRMSAIS